MNLSLVSVVCVDVCTRTQGRALLEVYPQNCVLSRIWEICEISTPSFLTFSFLLLIWYCIAGNFVYVWTNISCAFVFHTVYANFSRKCLQTLQKKFSWFLFSWDAPVVQTTPPVIDSYTTIWLKLSWFYIFAVAGWSAKIVKICTPWKFPAKKNTGM